MTWQYSLCATIAVVTALQGCSNTPSELELFENQIERGIKVTDNCFRDSLYVAFEDSGNCLAAVRFFEVRSQSKLCLEDTGIHCRRINEKETFAYGLFWRSIAHSLWTYGKPKEFDRAQASDKYGIMQYRDSAAVGKAYSACLAEEAAARSPTKIGSFYAVDAGTSVRVTRVISPLRPGQLCVREGYGEPFFESRT